MENKNTRTNAVAVHWFKSIDENGKLSTKGFIALEDFQKVVEELKPVGIKNVIFNPPATIVLWNDGTKTVVKAENEVFDKEKGLAMAICKRTNGNNGRYFEAFKKYCRSEDAPKRVPKRSGRYPWKEAVEALAQENPANINNEPAQLEEKETTTEKD